MATTFKRTLSTRQTATDLCVVGNLTIDVILRGVTAMPEWGHEVLCRERTESVAGQAGAVAFASAAMGLSPDVVSAVGDDEAGARIRDELSSAGVNVDAVVTVAHGTTPMTVAMVRPDGERAFVSDLGTLSSVNVVTDATRWVANRSTKVVALVGTSNVPNVERDTAVELFRVSRQFGALTVFDPGWDPLGWSNETVATIRAVLSETDLFLPNLDEARALSGRFELTEVLAVFHELCAGVTVIKGGASGSFVLDGDKVVNVKAIATEVDNAVGAGDVYDAGVVAGYLNGYDLLTSMSIAAAAASIYVGRRRTRFPELASCLELAQSVDIDVLAN